ncbi:hypothetical protein NDU88_006037 [Pleurodeles waltl]|uniref:Uncharacterized protein n=1 Tax=Pleurodeles waltl TaxID=8319 RepID=A0AAV7LR92_PLEWA|nr:hypothetical protein NDU88_006037 [Pleurodeles waltl]
MSFCCSICAPRSSWLVIRLWSAPQRWLAGVCLPHSGSRYLHHPGPSHRRHHAPLPAPAGRRLRLTLLLLRAARLHPLGSGGSRSSPTAAPRHTPPGLCGPTQVTGTAGHNATLSLHGRAQARELTALGAQVTGCSAPPPQPAPLCQAAPPLADSSSCLLMCVRAGPLHSPPGTTANPFRGTREVRARYK